MPSLPRRPSPREKKTVDVSTASGGCSARQPASYHARRKYEVLPQGVQLKKHWVQRRPESPVDPGIILNRWGRAYLTPLPGFFFGQDGKPAPPGSPAGSPVRQDCICENRSVGSGRSPLVDHRGQSCGRTVAGSELNLLVLIVLVFFDLDAQRLQKFHVLIVHLKIRIRGHRGH